jgi:hypothetical protein
VPSFRQHVDTLERWRRFPGLERLDQDDGGRVALTFDDGPDPDAIRGSSKSRTHGRGAAAILERVRAAGLQPVGVG